MSFDISKYAADVVNSTSKSIDRDFIGEGDHIVKIESVEAQSSAIASRSRSSQA